jgi:hypothetical protein
MNPEIAKTIATRRMDEMQAVAATERLARRTRTGRPAAALPRRGSAVGGGWKGRRPRRLGRWVPGWLQSA